MTKKESKEALKLYNELENIFYYHNKNLTKQQYYLLDDIREYLIRLSNKAYNHDQSIKASLLVYIS